MNWEMIFTFLLSASAITTQAQVREGTIEYNKEKQECLVIDYKHPPEAVEEALREKMRKLGYRTKEEKGLFNRDKGFWVINDAAIKEISHTRYDYALSIEKRSGKNEEGSILHLVIMQDNENKLSELRRNGDLGNARSFLTDIVPEIELAHLGLKIKDQEELVSKAEKKLESLRTDKGDMEKKLKKLQEDMDKNVTDQESQQAEIENLKKVLEELKAKKKD